MGYTRTMTKVRAAVTECPGRIRVHELLTTEAGADGPRAWRTEEVVSYAESFGQELQHFHECVVAGGRRRPRPRMRCAI